MTISPYDSPFTRPRTTLDLHAPGGLAALFARTRAEFGGHTMTAPAPEAGQQGTGQATQTGIPAAQQQVPAAQTSQATQAAQAGQATDVEMQEGEDAAAFLARVGPEGVARAALRYRREAGDRRQATLTAQQEAEQRATQAADEERQKLLDQLKPGLIALGVLKADEQPDPTKLTADLQAANQRATEQESATRTLQIELAVLRAAGPLGVVAERLLDSRKFADTVASLDPTAADFGSKIEAAMKEAADKDASFKSTRAVPAAGMPHVGGSGGQPGTARTPMSLSDAVNAQMNPTR